MQVLDMSGSAFCEKALEKHHFKGAGDQFECTICHRPRAMHLDDGFRPIYQDLDVGIWKPFGRVKPRNRAMGFKGEPKKRRAFYQDEGTVIWSS